MTAELDKAVALIRKIEAAMTFDWKQELRRADILQSEAIVPIEIMELRAFLKEAKQADSDRERVPINIHPDTREKLRVALMTNPHLHAVGYTEFIERSLRLLERCRRCGDEEQWHSESGCHLCDRECPEFEFMLR